MFIIHLAPVGGFNGLEEGCRLCRNDFLFIKFKTIQIYEH